MAPGDPDAGVGADQKDKPRNKHQTSISIKDGIVRQGWLERDEGMISSSFQRRWAVLGTNNSLSFYTTQKRQDLQGDISLKGVTDISTDKPLTKPKGNEFLYKVKVVCASGNHEFRCATSHDLDAWEQAISGKVTDLASSTALSTMWGAQFGMPVTQIARTKLPMYNAKIPDVLRRMKNYLYDNGGVKLEGAFRVAPNKEKFDQLKLKLNNNTFESCKDLHMITHGIKVWYRDLPVPVWKSMRISDISMGKTPVKAWRVVKKLDEPALSLTEWLLDLLGEIMMFQKHNKMGPKQLSRCIAPNLFDVSNMGADPQAMMSFSTGLSVFVENAIIYRVAQRQMRGQGDIAKKAAELAVPDPIDVYDLARKNKLSWVAHWDPESGEQYYENVKTSETSWDPPDVGYMKAPDWIRLTVGDGKFEYRDMTASRTQSDPPESGSFFDADLDTEDKPGPPPDVSDEKEDAPKEAES